MNHTNIIGKVTGMPVVTDEKEVLLVVETTHVSMNMHDEAVTRTQLHAVIAYGRFMEPAMDLRKGSSIAIEGGNYTRSINGNQVYCVVVNDLLEL